MAACSHKPPARHGSYTGRTGTQRAYTIAGRSYYPLPSAQGFRETGYASWYGPGFHGKATANGERYNMHAMTAAHRILPMNTWIRVKNLRNGREVVVRVNDRGPFVKNRIVDLSYSAAKKLGIVAPGTVKVEVTALGESNVKGDSVSGFRKYPELTTGDFYVQVGAFTRPENAYSLRDRLSDRNRKIVVRRYESGTGIFFRVQVFAAHDYLQARKVENSFECSGFPEAFVVRW